jgi:hypothetical protein
MTWKIGAFIGFGIVCLGISLALSRDRDKIRYHLESGSRIWINGSATLGSYECKTVAVYGTGNLDSDSATGDSSSIDKRSKEGTKVAVQVKLFDCGNPAMNKDMYNALKADNDSLISFELIDADIIYDSTRRNDGVELRTIGNLTVAGVTRTDTIYTLIKTLPDRKYKIVGEKSLSMLDFKIVPPTAFFGLIKANEKLIVGFDLIAAPISEKHNDNNAIVLDHQ